MQPGEIFASQPKPPLPGSVGIFAWGWKAQRYANDGRQWQRGENIMELKYEG